jgi:hypothetical protein
LSKENKGEQECECEVVHSRFFGREIPLFSVSAQKGTRGKEKEECHDTFLLSFLLTRWERSAGSRDIKKRNERKP